MPTYDDGGTPGQGAPAIQTSTTMALSASDEDVMLAKRAEEYFTYYEQQLLETKQSMLRWWKLYFAKKEDHRSEIEKKWRANIFPPRPYISVEAHVAVLMDIMLSVDPLIQVEGVDDKDKQGERAIEQLLDYTLRSNAWRKFQELQLRDAAVQGWAAYKNIYVEKKLTLPVFPTPKSQQDFAKAVQRAILAGAPPPPDWTVSPTEFEVWRKTVNMANMGPVPEPPYSGPREFIQYRGPAVVHVPIWDLYLDPLIQEIDDQHCVIHRMVQPKSWVETRVKAGVFNADAVSAAMEGWDGKKLSEQEIELYHKLGIPANTETNDPYLRNAVEVWEVWKIPEAQEPDGKPFQVILNRKKAVNAKKTMPFYHGMNPIRLVRNVLVRGLARGVSEYEEAESLFQELITLRNLRQDAVTMGVLPVYTKLREMGMTELEKKLMPGTMIPVSRNDAITQLLRIQLPPEAYREPQEIVADIEASSATGPNVQGATSTIGRVSATEAQGRLQQALLRHKLSAVRIEEEHNPSVKQWLTLWYQFSDSDIRQRIGGPGDPLLHVSKAELYEALQMDYRFRGATRAANKELMAQQLMQFYTSFAPLMLPNEVRALMRATAETLSLRNTDQIVTAEGTLMMTQQFQMQQQAQAAQMQATTEQMGAMGAQPPPSPTEGSTPEGEPQ